MSLASLRMLESATEEPARVLGLRFHPIQRSWLGLVDTNGTPYSNLAAHATPEEALADVLPFRDEHLVGPCDVEPASLADLKVLEAITGDVVAAGIDFTPGMGWGWTIEMTVPEQGSAMGFSETPEEALADLVTTLRIHHNALPE